MNAVSDDPRDILRAAGVECAEVGVYRLAADRWEVDSHDNGDESVNAADAAILALARLVAKYKWQRDATVGIAGYCEEEAQELLDEVDLEWHEEERRRREEHNA